VHNTLLSHRLVHLAEQQGKQGAVIEAIFKGYFENGINLSDINTLVDIAEAAGVKDSRAYLESDKDADIVLREYKDGTLLRIIV
jgi:predicted DsbA family dithiol-disulfide isomerase